jgi:uncharacterized membrane protein YqiK
MDAGDGVLPWILASGVILTGLAFAAIKVIFEHERAIVIRFGRVSRVGGPGVLALLPVVERVARICVRDSRMDSVVVRATTRDDITVWITVAAYFSVVDPGPRVRRRTEHLCTHRGDDRFRYSHRSRAHGPQGSPPQFDVAPRSASEPDQLDRCSLGHPGATRRDR